MGKASIGERSSRRTLGKINVVPAIAERWSPELESCQITDQKTDRGMQCVPVFLKLETDCFIFRRQAIIYLWLLCSIFLSVYLTDFELYLEKGEEGTWRHC